MSINRRQLFQTGLVACAGLAIPPFTRGIEPIPRKGEPFIKPSLAAYSFRQALDLKKKPKPAMSLHDFIDFAATQPLDAVELTAYYFAETTPEYLASLKQHATRLGLDISGTAIGNDFCLLDPDKYKLQLATVKQWIEHTARLGGKTMRIFAGNVPQGDTAEKSRERCVEALQEVCDTAAKYGVFLALENHGGITATAEEMLKIIAAVKHDSFGVNLDTGNFHTDDPYADLAKIAPYAVTVQWKTEIQPKGKPVQEADLKKLLEILQKANYRGYAALEYEAAEDANVAVPRYLTRFAKLNRTSQ